jgi:hypothetical protein
VVVSGGHGEIKLPLKGFLSHRLQPQESLAIKVCRIVSGVIRPAIVGETKLTVLIYHSADVVREVRRLNTVQDSLSDHFLTKDRLVTSFEEQGRSHASQGSK